MVEETNEGNVDLDGEGKNAVDSAFTLSRNLSRRLRILRPGCDSLSLFLVVIGRCACRDFRHRWLSCWRMMSIGWDGRLSRCWRRIEYVCTLMPTSAGRINVLAFALVPRTGCVSLGAMRGVRL